VLKNTGTLTVEALKIAVTTVLKNMLQASVAVAVRPVLPNVWHKHASDESD